MEALRWSLLSVSFLAVAGRPAADGWIDPETCSDCHASIVEDWKETPMWRALEPLRPGELDGLTTVEHPAAGYAYRLDEGHFLQTVLTPVDAAQRAHRRAAPIRFAIGAGVMDRSYAIEEHGRLWFAPLEVLSADGEHPRRAALAPPNGIDPKVGWGTPITPECLACHTDDPPQRDWPWNVVPRGWSPRGISCGACHAGAAEHVLWREAEFSATPLPGADPILDHDTLSREERMSVCAACHLQGDARIELVPGHIGPPEPGGDLLERRAVFVAREPSADLGFVSHTERLALSACYLESKAMSCETCHDPHRAMSSSGERKRTRDACLACHTGGSEAHPGSERTVPCSLPTDERGTSDCASCHMRVSGVFDVEHVEITDHWIRKRPGPPSATTTTFNLRFPEAPDADWKRFQWPGVEPPEHVDDPGLWMMAYSHGGKSAKGMLRMNRPVGEVVSALPMYHHVRASLLERAKKLEEAEASYRRALELDPDLAEARSNLGLLLGRMGRAEEGIALLTELIERYPRADGALRNRALLSRSLGRTADFERDIEQAIQLRPTPELLRAYALHCRENGRPDHADLYEAEALRLDPLR